MTPTKGERNSLKRKEVYELLQHAIANAWSHDGVLDVYIVFDNNDKAWYFRSGLLYHSPFNFRISNAEVAVALAQQLAIEDDNSKSIIP